MSAFLLSMSSGSMGQKQVPNTALFFVAKQRNLDALTGKIKGRLLDDVGSLANFTGFKTDLDIVKIQGQHNFYRLRT